MKTITIVILGLVTLGMVLAFTGCASGEYIEGEPYNPPSGQGHFGHGWMDR